MDTGIGGFDGSWDLDRWTWAATTTAIDLDLRARDVELGAARAAGTVETDVLSTEQVLARGCWSQIMWYTRRRLRGYLRVLLGILKV